MTIIFDINRNFSQRREENTSIGVSQGTREEREDWPEYETRRKKTRGENQRVKSGIDRLT